MSMQERINGGTDFSKPIQKAGQLLKDMGPDMARILVMLTDGRVDPYQGGCAACVYGCHVNCIIQPKAAFGASEL